MLKKLNKNLKDDLCYKNSKGMIVSNFSIGWEKRLLLSPWRKIPSVSPPTRIDLDPKRLIFSRL